MILLFHFRFIKIVLKYRLKCCCELKTCSKHVCLCCLICYRKGQSLILETRKQMKTTSCKLAYNLYQKKYLKAEKVIK